MDKRELILNAALNLFVDNGFHGTATGKIAQEAGVATGTLFNYFKTKDELVIALYISVKNELAEYLGENSAVGADTRELMRYQFLASLRWALENTAKFRFIQQFHSSPYIGKLEQEVIDKQVQPHLMLIQKGINENLIKPLPIDFIYSLVSSTTNGLFQYVTTKQLSDIEQLDIIQKTFDMMWDMLT